MDDIWRTIREVTGERRRSGALAATREQQLVAWLWGAVEATLVASLHAAPGVAAIRETVEADVRAGRVTPALAASRLLAAFRPGPS